MLFNASDKWWGGKGKRSRPHEGLDILLYGDKHDKVHHLDHKTKIPSMYNGTVVNIIEDFLGKSILIEHGFTDKNNSSLCTFYGHTKPLGGLNVGDCVQEGEIVSTLAYTGSPKTGICPHLHISIGFVPQNVSFDLLDWNVIGDPVVMTLFDPLEFIKGNFRLVDNDTVNK